MKLLVTRPQPGADATAARIRAAGHEAVVSPLFEAQPVDWEIDTRKTYDALLITSANAIRHAGQKREGLVHLPVFAVGQNSAHIATSHGFNVEYVGYEGVEQLLPHIQAHKLLWLAGDDHMDFELPQSIDMDVHIVYRSVALPQPKNFAESVLKVDYVLLHSSRGAMLFSELISGQGIEKKQISIAVFSEKIAQAAGSGWDKVRVARYPSDEHLLFEL